MLKNLRRPAAATPNKTDWSDFDAWFAQRYPAPKFTGTTYHAITKK